MRVLLINPSYWTGGKLPLGFVKVSSVPLGLGYIAAMLESEAVKTKILDMDMSDIKIEDLKEKLDKFRPDMVGITSFTSNYSNAVKIAKAVKSHRPEAFIVLGGVHPTFVHTEVLKTVPEIDVVVRYEGEYTMRDLVDVVEKGGKLNKVKGITYREGGGVFSTPLRSKIKNLDELPFPAHHLLEPSIEAYLDKTYPDKNDKTENKKNIIRNIPILTTRGCPFGCIFCSTASLHGHQYRKRSNSNVVDEIEYMQDKYGINNVSFVDDNFTMQKERVFDLCQEMKERDLSLKWGCSTRADLLSENLLKTMKDAGCDNIFFGIESASQETLGIVRKEFKIDQAREVVKLTEEIGIKTHCSFILGLPGESLESLNQMVKFIEEVKPSGRILPNTLDILPGTKLYNHIEDYFPDGPDIHHADIVKTQLEMFLKFYEINAGITELTKIIPPDIQVC